MRERNQKLSERVGGLRDQIYIYKRGTGNSPSHSQATSRQLRAEVPPTQQRSSPESMSLESTQQPDSFRSTATAGIPETLMRELHEGTIDRDEVSPGPMVEHAGSETLQGSGRRRHLIERQVAPTWA